jgi:dTDP-4-dehydrorhamnose 3,5-epimerase
LGFNRGAIQDVVVKPLRKFVDERGWLCETYRHDGLEHEYHPAMSYISLSRPGVTRGPHEHEHQADLFVFLGPSNFKLVLWDNRPKSPSYANKMVMVIGEDAPTSVLVPKGVVHGYQNVGGKDGIVINSPNRLFMGVDKKEPIDEIRHEIDPNSPFLMNGSP